MSQYFQIHPQNPQLRLLRGAVDILREGGLIAYPTDSCYALGCRIGDKSAMERIRRIRRTDRNHNFTLVCRDLSEIAIYARVDNVQYRLLRSLTPGPYTFILRATHEVPRRLQHPKRRTIGIRIPDNRVVQDLLGELGEPIMSTTLIAAGDSDAMTDPEDIRDRLEHDVDLVLDGGVCVADPTTVLDLMHTPPQVLRAGSGSLGFLQD